MMTETEDFFNTILSDKGFPVIAIFRGKSLLQQLACESISDFFRILNLQYEQCNGTQKSIHFGISTLAQKYIFDKTGKYQTRVVSNCAWIKSLILDIDIDPDGLMNNDLNRPCYLTQEEAILGVSHLCAQLSLPNPIIVNSGYGLHVYWPFSEQIDTKLWKEIAAKFKAVCYHIDSRLVVDSSRVADCTSLLRAPESSNNKDSQQPKAVKIIQKYSSVFWAARYFEQHLDFYIKEKSIILGHLKVKPAIGELAPLFDNEKAEFSQIYKKCNWFRDYMDNPEHRHYNDWHASINLATKGKYTFEKGEIFNGEVLHEQLVLEGEQLAIYFSQDYSKYDEEETLFQYQDALNAGGKSARLCATLETYKPHACAECKYKPYVNTPLQLPTRALPADEIVVEKPITIAGELVASERTVFPKPPYPYYIGEDGGVYMNMKGPEGQKLPSKVIYEYRIIPLGRIHNTVEETESVEIELQLPYNQIRRFAIPGGTFHDSKSLTKILGDRGVYIRQDAMKYLVDYLISYTKEIQKSERATTLYPSFGWKDKHTEEVKFVFYDALVKPSGIFPYKNTAPSVKMHGQYASSSGSLTAWKDAINIYHGIPNMEPYIIAIMLSFGAPLLTFLDEFGMLYNLVGPGGEGKSSSAYLASSVWGKPTVSHGLAHDTPNALLNTLGIFNTIPMVYDELTNLDPKILSEFAYAISNGRAKNRLRETGEARINNSFWQTFVLSSSNYSLYGKLGELKSGNNANAYRILEYQAPASNSDVNTKMSRAKNLVQDNYGIAGKVFMKHCLANYSDVLRQTRLARETLTDKDRSRERYWVSAQVCIQTAGYISRKLELHDYEPGLLIEYMRDMAPRDEVEFVTGDPMSKLNDYFLRNINNTIKVMDNMPTFIDTDLKSMSTIALRIEGSANEVHRAYIPVQAMEMWCKVTNTDLTWLRTELIRRKVLVRAVNRRLGANTKYPSINARCWEIDMQHPLVTGLNKRITEEKITAIRK